MASSEELSSPTTAYPRVVVISPGMVTPSDNDALWLLDLDMFRWPFKTAIDWVARARAARGRATTIVGMISDDAGDGVPSHARMALAEQGVSIWTKPADLASLDAASVCAALSKSLASPAGGLTQSGGSAPSVSVYDHPPFEVDDRTWTALLTASRGPADDE